MNAIKAKLEKLETCTEWGPIHKGCTTHTVTRGQHCLTKSNLLSRE